MKKVLSLVLVIAMVLSSMSFAFAGTFKDVTGNYEDAVEALVALGVVKGYEDGTYRPERTITRAELAKILVEALGYGELVAGASSNFTDTQNHWANGYVAIAAGTGLVLGMGDGTFAPDVAVTYDQAYTMVIRALGYTDASLKGTWPTNFKVKAIDLGLTDDVVMKTSAADRGGVAQIIFNALEVELVEVDAENAVTGLGKDLIDKIAKLEPNFQVTPEKLNPENKVYAGDKIDLEPYMYEYLDVYTIDGDVVYIKDSNSIVIEGTLTKGSNNEFVVTDKNDKEFNLDLDHASNTAKLYLNGVEESLTFDKLNNNFESIKVVGFEANENTANDKIDLNNEIVGIVALKQDEVVQINKEYVAGKTKIDSILLPTVTEDGKTVVDLDNVKVFGAAETLEDIQEDDVVVVYRATGKVMLGVSRDTVEGKVKRVEDGKYYIDGVGYEVNNVQGSVLPTVALGAEGTFYLDHNGEIVIFDGSTDAPTDYAVIIDIGYGKIETNVYGKKSIKSYPVLKLATEDNEIVEFSVYAKLDNGALVENDLVEVDGQDSTKLVLKAGLDLDKKDLVKYGLNNDGQIKAIQEVADVQVITYSELDFSKATNKLASNAVVFDATDDDNDYNVVDVDDLGTKESVFAYRNTTTGLIEVLILEPDTFQAPDSLYAYIYEVNDAYNDDDDLVEYVGMFVEDDDVSAYTKDDNDLSAGVYKVTFDGTVVDTDTATATTTSAIASVVNVSSRLVKVGATWYSVADNATIVDATGAEVELADLYDIEEGVTTFDVYADSGVIGMIVIK